MHIRKKGESDLRKAFLLSIIMVMSVSLFLVGCSSSSETSGPTEKEATPSNTTGSKLDTIKDRGYLIVGANNQLPGFGYVGSSGDFEGFDIDYGKVMAVAIFGDPSKVEYRPLAASERFTALQTGEVDTLIRILRGQPIVMWS